MNSAENPQMFRNSSESLSQSKNKLWSSGSHLTLFIWGNVMQQEEDVPESPRCWCRSPDCWLCRLDCRSTLKTRNRLKFQTNAAKRIKKHFKLARKSSKNRRRSYQCLRTRRWISWSEIWRRELQRQTTLTQNNTKTFLTKHIRKNQEYKN